MRSMLSICDRFASDFNVTFNENKYKYIMFKVCSHCAIRDNIAPVPQFLHGARTVGNVSSRPSLGHIFSANLWDNDDMLVH